MKTYVIAAQHGDEVFGLKILGALYELNQPNSMIRIGNPEAVAKGKRYIETDLNRSYSVNYESKEAMLAHSIQSEIHKYDPDYILDIHTSVSAISRVAIVAELTADTQCLASCLGMKAIVIMPPKFSAKSLIGNYPSKAISLEFGRYQRSDKLAQSIAEKIGLLNEDYLVSAGQELPIYKVTSVITKNHSAVSKIINLEFNIELGGYPFLAGENTYINIGGFLAEKK